MVLDRFQVTRYIETRQCHHFGTHIKVDKQDSRNTIRVKEWQKTDVHFLMCVY